MSSDNNKSYYSYKNISLAVVGATVTYTLYKYLFGSKEKKEKKVSKEKKKVQFEVEENEQDTEEIVIYMRVNGVDMSRARLRVIEKTTFVEQD